MKIVIFILTVFFYTSTYAQSFNCGTGNPCNLGGYFNSTNGYNCLQYDATNVLCTCPVSGYEFNGECRLCNRTNSLNNACRNLTGKLEQCLETDDCGTSFACLCNDPITGVGVLTTNADCDTTYPLVCPAISGSAGPSPCLHGGVFLGNGICHCPSGYGGTLCQVRADTNLCERIICKNNGRCAIQRPNGPYESLCLCPTGSWGEYCELTGTPGFCSSSSCMNNGACRENVIGSTRHAYCQCQPGYNGTKCEQNYFTCTVSGKYRDNFLHEQGKYFECVSTNGVLRLERRTCPKGLRFDSTKKICMIKID